ncbi:MAG: hypothetical protein OHK0037_24090 [Elainellaceae cyanobacterium]
MTHLPALLVCFRLAIAPILLWDAFDGSVTPWFLVGYVAAFLSDIFDGVIARRLSVSTARLRAADSWADVTLYLCLAVAAWRVHPEILVAFRWPLLSVVAVQLLWWVMNLAKYGKPASYHTYSAKLWGITLFFASIALFGFGQGGVALWAAVAVGLVHTIEEIVMTLVLPTWQHDVLSLAHALRLRRQAEAGEAMR